MMFVQEQTAFIENGQPRVWRFDPLLLVIYLLLVMFGMVAVYSATIAQAFETGDSFAFLRTNLVHVFIAVSTMVVVSFIPIRIWQNLSPIFLLGGIVMLALVFIPQIGVEVNGSTRWINVAGWNFQPSEFAELGFLLFASDYLANRRGGLDHFFRDVFPILVIYLIFAGLLLLEPDFGSAVVLGGVLFGMLFVSHMRWSHVGILAGIGVLGLVVLIILEDYRIDRLTSFLNPWEDPYGKGFQLIQSLIAFGRGEWYGVGMGNSVMKLFYLPYAGSDFLLAIIAEELGFVGICTVILLFTTLIWRIFYISRLAKYAGDRFALTVAQAFAMLIAISALINMGVNMGVLPTKGLTLPLMSEGGTSLIAFSAALGIIFSIDRSSRRRLQD